MKNESGFTLLEIIITISLAGIVLAVMSKTIKTGLDMQSFLNDRNAIISWSESVLAAYNNKDDLAEGVANSNNSELIKKLEILEQKSLPKSYQLTTVKIDNYQKDNITYAGLYKLKIDVDYKLKNKEQRYELISLLQKK
ncbi:pilus assembly FimT family protein [Halanaerobium salsuginis]|uniref:Prepilin-type N-terminal cleavage/methylation domain-containing protein n=1 Tax=Halanaerobium salsuginis TaxID=29563 RepID=A0A1I4EWS4_9FIRM|nr:prepilin-type N-terminal cleavage/methylation domain-containing protein [Halanaerobium salsuginis]SFL08977.1 prepilin-type N-terminal cleavage/methylation domain-containing protein [Halanaerobium salsuginis]